jgi:hypothetical protein
MALEPYRVERRYGLSHCPGDIVLLDREEDDWAIDLIDGELPTFKTVASLIGDAGLTYEDLGMTGAEDLT